MAVIRPPAARSFRHYGSPPDEQPELDNLPLPRRRKTSMIGKMAYVVFMGLLMTLLTAALTTAFFYAGWNWGVVPAVSRFHELTPLQAFWFALFFCTFGSCFRSTFSVSSSD